MQSQFNSWQKQDLKSEIEHLAASTWQASGSGRVTRRRWCASLQLEIDRCSTDTRAGYTINVSHCQHSSTSRFFLSRADPCRTCLDTLRFSRVFNVDWQRFSRTESYEYRLVWAAVHTSLPVAAAVIRAPSSRPAAPLEPLPQPCVTRGNTSLSVAQLDDLVIRRNRRRFFLATHRIQSTSSLSVYMPPVTAAV